MFLSTASGQRVVPARAGAPPEDKIDLGGVTHESHGDWDYLRGSAKVETSDYVIYADEIDYNSDTAWAYARGHVRFEQYVTGEKLNADHVEYNLKTEEGKFFVVTGTSPAKVMTSPGLLTTASPFYFEAMWAQRIRDRYIIHDGFITDCILPKPWWTFSAPVFDIIPDDRAIGHKTLFRLKRIPLFYLPVFYRPLGKHPRHSGFLTPNIGNSNNRGYMIGAGYYWAINRSYDATYTLQYFTLRGPAHTFDFRGKPNDVSDFNFLLYDVQDKGINLGSQANPNILKAGGLQFSVTARTEFQGFTARLDYNYLSSFLFRQSFSQSFLSAVQSGVDSVGYLQRHFDKDEYVLNIAFERNQFFESTISKDQVIIQKLPYVEFASRDKQVAGGPLPVWVGFDATGGLLTREEPTVGPNNTIVNGVDTGNGVARIDVEPRVMTAFNFKGLSLVPSLSFRATQYGQSWATNSYAPTSQSGLAGSYSNPAYALSGANVLRHSLDLGLELTLPTLEKVYTPSRRLHLGSKLKHVIELRGTYENVRGVGLFTRYVHFDANDLLSNTNQLAVMLTNRIYKKDQNGNISEIASWEVKQERYFDPTFGGAVVSGQRNVVFASEEFSSLAFLDRPRGYSPVVSTLRLSPLSFLSFDWRTEYDPLRGRLVDHAVYAGFRRSNYFLTIGDTEINSVPLLTPNANQITFGGGFGNTNRKGWNAAISDNYDLLQHRLNYQLGQVSYNTDCCGFSVEYRRFSFGTRNENQFLMSFTLANIGAFGSLQKQARLF